LAEVVLQVWELKYASAAQGIHRFGRLAEEGTELAAFTRRLKAKLLIIDV